MKSPTIRNLALVFWLPLGLILFTNTKTQAQRVVLEKASGDQIRMVISRLNSSDVPCLCTDCSPVVHPCPSCCPDNLTLEAGSDRQKVKQSITPGVYRIDLFRGERKLGTFRGVDLKSGEHVKITVDAESKPEKPEPKTDLKPLRGEKPQ